MDATCQSTAQNYRDWPDPQSMTVVSAGISNTIHY